MVAFLASHCSATELPMNYGIFFHASSAASCARSAGFEVETANS